MHTYSLVASGLTIILSKDALKILMNLPQSFLGPLVEHSAFSLCVWCMQVTSQSTNKLASIEHLFVNVIGTLMGAIAPRTSSIKADLQNGQMHEFYST
jgi:hypothetical protein